jgi:hypothetical protein
VCFNFQSFYIFKRLCLLYLLCLYTFDLFVPLTLPTGREGGGGSGGDFIAVAETATTEFPHHPPPFMSHLKK